MLVDIVMPKMGESITEGTIVKWHKSLGQFVVKDEPLLDIATDKVDAEIPSSVAGVLQEICVAEKMTVAVQTVIARLETDSGLVDQKKSESLQLIDTTKMTKTFEMTKTNEMTQTTVNGISSSPASQAQIIAPQMKSTRYYSPALLTLSKQVQMDLADLAQIPGSGKGGRLTKKDLLQYLERSDYSNTTVKFPIPSHHATPAATYPVMDASEPPLSETWRDLDPLQKRMAQTMRSSLDNAAHAYIVGECDTTHMKLALQGWREEFFRQHGFKLTLTPIILHAVVQNLQKFPLLNSHLLEQKIGTPPHVHLGVAMATERGLMVPVIHQAQKLSIFELALALEDLQRRMREKKLKLEDLQGATFSVSNFGVFGNLMGFPIINPPNAAILGVGAIQKRPVVWEVPEGDSLMIRPMMYLSVAIDHRIIDGASASQFLSQLIAKLQS